MPIERGEGQFSHLQLERIPDLQLDRQTRRNYVPKRPPAPSDRVVHAQAVNYGFTQVSDQISASRQRIGIDPDRLFVLEFDSINLNLRDSVERYQAWVVDEYLQKNGEDENYRFLIQFPTETSRQLFMEDLQLYGSESEEAVTLPLGMRSTFFDALQDVRKPSRQERIGVRLAQEGLPEQETFYLDVDFWHPPNDGENQNLQTQIRSLCRQMDGAVLDEVRTASLFLARIRANPALAEVLMDLDLVARVDLPPVLAPAYTKMFDTALPESLPVPSGEDPIVCVVDSGVLSGHPLLVNWVIEEHDFDTGEDTPTDLNGHGTSVAGLVVYGSVAECLETQVWQPKVKICSAKVLRNGAFDCPVFPDDRRVEAITEEAIRYFVRERQCKIFNLCLGIEYEVYGDGRQFAWAEKLDELARELDIVIVVSAGNRSNPPIPDDSLTREQLQETLRDRLLNDPEQRLCNPATAALALTVGAIASSDAIGRDDIDGGVRLRDAFAVAPLAAPPPFTRIGSGYASNPSAPSVKPDLIDYGGNYALQTIAGSGLRWVTNHLNLGEPTLCLEQNGRFVGARIGTSFAAPHVAHAAAIGMAGLKSVLGRLPSANLIRALVGSAAQLPPCPEGWLGDENSILRSVGYGICSVEDLAWSRQNRVRLVTEDTIEDNKLHVYRVEVPEIFLATRGKRGVTVALAYDPPVRASRREYLARTMLVEVLQGLTTEEVELYRAKQEEPKNLPTGAEIDLRPTKSRLQWSTLQVRSKTWQRRPMFSVPKGEEERAMHFVVRCQQRFPSDDSFQRYGLVIVLWHESEEIELYQALQNQVVLRATRIRVRG
jgi:subtilisin family serine protease